MNDPCRNRREGVTAPASPALLAPPSEHCGSGGDSDASVVASAIAGWGTDEMPLARMPFADAAVGRPCKLSVSPDGALVQAVAEDGTRAAFQRIRNATVLRHYDAAGAFVEGHALVQSGARFLYGELACDRYSGEADLLDPSDVSQFVADLRALLEVGQDDSMPSRLEGLVPSACAKAPGDDAIEKERWEFTRKNWAVMVLALLGAVAPASRHARAHEAACSVD